MVKLKIKEQRIKLGMTQQELAEKVGDFQPHVQRWEKGQIGIRLLKKVAKALGTTMDDLVEEEDEPEKSKT